MSNLLLNNLIHFLFLLIYYQKSSNEYTQIPLNIQEESNFYPIQIIIYASMNYHQFLLEIHSHLQGN